MDMNLKVKIYLEDGRGKFMGIGVLWLLRGIEEKGSLRAAAAELGISYTKAYGMISGLEKALDVKILERRHGGSSRGGAVLTDYARQFAELYDGFQSECKELLEEPFDTFRKKLAALPVSG